MIQNIVFSCCGIPITIFIGYCAHKNDTYFRYIQRFQPHRWHFFVNIGTSTNVRFISILSSLVCNYTIQQICCIVKNNFQIKPNFIASIHQHYFWLIFLFDINCTSSMFKYVVLGYSKTLYNEKQTRESSSPACLI